MQLCRFSKLSAVWLGVCATPQSHEIILAVKLHQQRCGTGGQAGVWHITLMLILHKHHGPTNIAVFETTAQNRNPTEHLHYKFAQHPAELWMINDRVNKLCLRPQVSE